MASSLILKALEQSKKNLIVPLRSTTLAFLSKPRTSVEYNLYLQSISHIPFQTPEATRTVKSILAQVDQLSVSISPITYTRLIHPLFTPRSLLIYLHHRLREEQHLSILLAFLRVYSKLSDTQQQSLFFFSKIKHHPLISPHILNHASTLLHSQFHILSKDLSIPSHQLIRTFLHHSSSSSYPLLPLYTSLINGLILRKRPKLASSFFSKLLKLNLSLDIPALSAGISALTRSSKPHLAFQLLQSYYPTLLSSPNSLIPLLSFLTSLNRISRPDISTLFFFLYPSLYPSSPLHNSLMLNILLQSARSAIKMHINIQTAKNLIPDNLKSLLKYLHSKPNSTLNNLMSKLNLQTSTFIHKITSSLGSNLHIHQLISHPLPPFGKQRPAHIPKNSSHPHPRLYASNYILSHLGHPSRGGLRQFTSSFAYENIHCAIWARIVFLRVLAGIESDLWKVKPPVIAFVPSQNLDSFFHTLWIPYVPTHFHHPSLWHTLLMPSTPRKPFYPSIIPTNSNFFNYLLLFALSSSPTTPEPTLHGVNLSPDGTVSPTTTSPSAPSTSIHLPPPTPLEIPQTLAWMRTLNIQPSISTLAIALVLWGEVCAFVDAHAHHALSYQGQDSKLKAGEQQYLLLVSWLRSWVGEQRLPHWRTLQKWRGVVKAVRGGGAWVEEEE